MSSNSCLGGGACLETFHLVPKVSSRASRVLAADYMTAHLETQIFKYFMAFMETIGMKECVNIVCGE